MSFDYDLPKNWQWVKVGDVQAKEKRATITGPFGSSIGKRFFQENGVPVIRGNNLSKGATKFIDDGFVFISEEKAEELSGYKAYPGDLILTAAGTLGQVGIIPEDCKYEYYIISNKQMRARFDATLVDPEFAYYWFSSKSMVSYIQSIDTGSTIPLINLGIFRKLPMPLPPLEDQVKIKTILKSVDDKIDNNCHINQNLEHIAQAIFESWFVDFEPVKAKIQAKQNGQDPERAAMRAISGKTDKKLNAWMQTATPEQIQQLTATAALFPDELVDTDLGPIPIGWGYKQANDVAEVAIGKTPPRKEPQWFSESTEDIRWISIKDMGKSGVYALKTSEYLTEEGVNKFNVRRIPDNTVLLSFKLTVGRVAITHGEMLSNEAIAHFNLSNNSPLTTEYLYLYLRQFDYSNLGSTSSIATAVNSKTIKNMPILVPGTGLVTCFNDAVPGLFKQIKNFQIQNDSLNEIRDSLLPRLLSGELGLAP